MTEPRELYHGVEVDGKSPSAMYYAQRVVLPYDPEWTTQVPITVGWYWTVIGDFDKPETLACVPVEVIAKDGRLRTSLYGWLDEVIGLRWWLPLSVRRGEKKSFFLVFCPACDAGHLFEVPVGAGQSIDYQAPTFMGLKLTGRGALGGVTVRCHLKVVNGRIKFLNDCPHAMRGKVVEMAVIPKDYGF
jgi:hypothetical protein